MTAPRSALIAALLIGCSDPQLPSSWFDGPAESAVLQPWQASPFNEPVGFVANSRNGTIVPIDLKHASLLADQLAAPYLPPRLVATGDQRQLGPLIAWGQGDGASVFAIDYAFGVVLEAPYIESISAAGEPQPPTLAASEPLFVDADDSGSDATIEGLLLRHGTTTTEDWTFEFANSAWWAFGSRSGKQARTFRTGETFTADSREVELRITGDATTGDRIELRTDTGLREHVFDGMPLSLFRVPNQDLMVIGIWNEAADRGELVLWDMVARTTLSVLELADGGQPWRFAFDPSADTLWVGDAALPQIYGVEIDLDDFGGSAITTLDAAAPVASLTWVGGAGDPEFGDVPFANLYAAPAGLNRVDVYDLLEERWVDVNPLDAVVGGLDLNSPVVGLSATEEPVLLQSVSNTGARDDDQVVVVTTFDGSIRMFEGRTGCLAIDGLGPRAGTSSSTDSGVQFSDSPPTSDPIFYTDAATLSPISPLDCGGVVQSEAWTVTYDEVVGSWEVEGTRSGLQQQRAVENQRFVTDDGAFSFLMLSGAQPSSDGDRFEFSTTDGVLRISEVLRSGSQAPTPLELPAAPVVFSMEQGPTGGSWDPDRTEMHALVPVTAADVVLRVRLQSWSVEVLYD